MQPLPGCLLLLALSALPASAGTVRYDLDPGPVTVERTAFQTTDRRARPAGSFVETALTKFHIEIDTEALDLRGARLDLTAPRAAAITGMSHDCCTLTGFLAFDASQEVVDWSIEIDDGDPVAQIHPTIRFTPDAVTYTDTERRIPAAGSAEVPLLIESFGSVAGPFSWSRSGSPASRAQDPLPGAVPVPPALPLLAGALLAGAAALRLRRA